MTAAAQNTMRIHYQGGTTLDISLDEIDSVTFVTTTPDDPQPQASLTGSWLWGKAEAGYYELLTLNADRTYTGLDTYFEYGFDTHTYGSYSLRGSLLTLFSYGFGYQRVLRWFVVGLTANALDVVTQMGSFTYYRLQPDDITLQLGSTLAPTDDGCYIFADGTTLAITDGSIRALAAGTTYVQYQQPDGTIVAYKVVVQ